MADSTIPSVGWAFRVAVMAAIWAARSSPLRAAGGNSTVCHAAPASSTYLELVEFQNRKAPVVPASITDIGVGYVGFEVKSLDAFLKRAVAAGARPVTKSGIVTMRSGTRVVMVRDPDVGMFVELFEQPAK